MLRLGLCCKFRSQPIKFATTTVSAVSKLSRENALKKLSSLCLANADALMLALNYCHENGIGCFRVTSQILPLKTHPVCGYNLLDLPEGEEIVSRFKACGSFVKSHQLRTCFHPDQFVVLNSRREEVVESSRLELEYQAELATWIGADVINIHGGGAFGNKKKALEDFGINFQRLSENVRSRLTIENDDTTFTPSDLLPLCRSLGIPFVYDIHHHRCHPDELTELEATRLAVETWNREPLFHISSPAGGWGKPQPERHHDFVDSLDFPDCWRAMNITVEVEAKAKELAVLKLIHDLT